MIARIPPKTTAFKLSANFNHFSPGQYSIRWRVKILDDFNIGGIRFLVRVSYEMEPDTSGSLDIAMESHKLQNLENGHWYSLDLDEKLVIHPHHGSVSVQVVLCNLENVDRSEYSGLAIEHVEVRPFAVAAVQPGVGELPIGLSLSATGDQLAVFQEPHIGDWLDGSNEVRASLPFMLFNNPLASPLVAPSKLDGPLNSNVREQSKTAVGDAPSNHSSAASTETQPNAALLDKVACVYEPLRTFVGYGEFLPDMKKDVHSRDIGGHANEDARTGSSMFVSCSGLYLDVYKISCEKRWSHLHAISLADLVPALSRRITCVMMMRTIGSNAFVWPEDGGRSYTVWNLLQGSIVTRFSTIEISRFVGSYFSGHNNVAMSPRGSIVAFAKTDGTLATYSADTGMAIDDRQFAGYEIKNVEFCDDGGHLFIILRNSFTSELQTKILDAYNLRSESITSQPPILTAGSTVWNRGIMFVADGPKINCYLSDSPSNPKVSKSSETVLKADPADVVYESHIDDDIQYRILCGLHRELSRTGNGSSYWVHRVEIMEENLSLRTQRLIFSFVPEPWLRVKTTEVTNPENLMSAFFLPCGTRFAVIGIHSLQIWKLPSIENSKCELQFIWSQPKDETDRDFSFHGSAYKSERVGDYYSEILAANIYLDAETGNTMAEVKMNDRSKMKTILTPGLGTIGIHYAIIHCLRSVHLLAAAYAFSSKESEKSRQDSVSFTFEDHAEAIARFTLMHINYIISMDEYSPKKRGHSRANLAQMMEPATLNSREHDLHGDILPHVFYKRSKSDTKNLTTTGFVTRHNVVAMLTLLLDHPYLQRDNQMFVKGMLKNRNGEWIPQNIIQLNPFIRAIESGNGELVEAFIEYCLRNAKRYSTAYLTPVVQGLYKLSKRYPALLADVFKKASYIRTYNSSVVKSRNANDCKKTVFSLQSQLTIRILNTPDILNIKKPVQERRDRKFPSRVQSAHNTDRHEFQSHTSTIRYYVASFDLIWNHKIRSSTESTAPRNMKSWAHALFYVILYKFKMKSEAIVEFHDFTLEMLDSPAISALIEYKWNTIGFISVYNVVDLAAFGLPLAGSINQLLIHSKKISGDTPLDGNAGLFSFSVLFMALQFLFELRVNESVCQFVTIIISILGKIRMFFVILIGGIIAFSVAMLYMLHSCPFETCVTPTTGFPTHFYKAFSSTFFIIGGRYDPISDELDTDNWAFITLMIVYFFFMVILLLNILIALINVAFNDSDIIWRLAWLENRMRFLESAENLSYHIPGFRQTYDWFPNEIYYHASELEAETYESKYQIVNKSNLSVENRFMIDTISVEQSAIQSAIQQTQQTQRASQRDVLKLSKDIEYFNQDIIKLTELLAALVAQTTTTSEPPPDVADSEDAPALTTDVLGSAQQAQPSSVELNDPPVSSADPTRRIQDLLLGRNALFSPVIDNDHSHPIYIRTRAATLPLPGLGHQWDSDGSNDDDGDEDGSEDDRDADGEYEGDDGLSRLYHLGEDEDDG
ncbi:hypothetical protein BGX26_012090 [Mortierella sp. AD094]|nr:hypothetical protein BGX26_012090 [Mortierella sp. AD094]